MAYVKQFTITTGQPAEPTELMENFEDARRYINQGSIAADLSNDSVDFTEIVKGELTTFSHPEHQFTCGNGYGMFKTGSQKNINAFTNTNKQEYLSIYNQVLPPVAPGDQHEVVQFITIPDSAKEVVLEHRALVTYRVWFDVTILESPIPDADNVAVIPRHRGTTYFWMTKDGGETREGLTEGRFYDETTYVGNPAPSSWAGPATEDPNWDVTAADGFAANISAPLYRRQYCMYYTDVLAAGTYQFGVVANIHHELGLVKVQNITIETENVGASIA